MVRRVPQGGSGLMVTAVVDPFSPRLIGKQSFAANSACALSLDLLLLKCFLSLSLLLLLDEPQPRKTRGKDHHDDKSDVFYHRSCPELMFTDQVCGSVSHSAIDPNQKRFLRPA